MHQVADAASAVGAVVGAAPQGAKWHSMKGRFRPLFDPSRVDTVEDWYNRTAPPKLRDAFRAAVKGLLYTSDAEVAAVLGTTAAGCARGITPTPTPALIGGRSPTPGGSPEGVDTVKRHRAKHVVGLYGGVLSDLGRRRAVAWLYGCTEAEAEAFRDAMASAQSALPPVSVTKATWVNKSDTATLPDRTRFHKVIDWSSCTAAERVRSDYLNPMDTKRTELGLLSLRRPSSQSTAANASVFSATPEPGAMAGSDGHALGGRAASVLGSIDPRRHLRSHAELAAGAAAAMASAGTVPGQLALKGRRPVGAVAALLTADPDGLAAANAALRQRRGAEMKSGQYEVDPTTGTTTFRSKAAAAGLGKLGAALESSKERIVATFSEGGGTASWRTAMKEHYTNATAGVGAAGASTRERVDPSRHPCVTRVTAATNMCVPSLTPLPR